MTVVLYPGHVPTKGQAIAKLCSDGWLARRPCAFRRLLLERAEMRKYQAGEVVFTCGDAPDGMYGLIDGVVHMRVPNDAGQEFLVQRADSGFWIGDLGVFAHEARVVTLSCPSESWLCFIPSDKLFEIVEVDVRHYRDFYALSHMNMEASLHRSTNMTLKYARQRLALRLLHDDETASSEGGWISFPQEQLAELASVSVPTLQQILREFCENHLIEVGYSRLRVTNRVALADAARA